MKHLSCTVLLRAFIAAIIVVATIGLAYGLNYMYFTHDDVTSFGDHFNFWHGDTLSGPIRSNSQILIMQDPRFNDFVITTAADFWRGMSYNPQFRHDFPPVFNAPLFPVPTHAAQIRALALEQGHFFSAGDSMQARVKVLTDRLRIWWQLRGLPFDTANFSEHFLPDSAVVFFECGELHLFGLVGGKLIIGSSRTILLEDNLVYASANERGLAPAGHSEKLGVVAEGDIKIQNSWANGRENSHRRGNNQRNMDSTSIVLDGFYVALGESFTFEQQNDSDSGYVCIPCGCNPNGSGGGPDDRGTIYLFGGIMQMRRGYVHRSSCTSTGYLRNYRYDNDLRYWNFPLFDAAENEISATAIDFGATPVGQTMYDTLRMRNEYVPIKLDSFRVAAPFSVAATPDSFMWIQTIPVSFAPTAVGVFRDTLRFYNAYYQRWFAVPVQGEAQALGSHPETAPLATRYALAAYPNPFNPATQIEFKLPTSGPATVAVFDILGQQVATLHSGNLAAGTHRVTFDGQRFPSGIYFVRLETAKDQQVMKLVLMK
jgi:hypothetical protein